MTSAPDCCRADPAGAQALLRKEGAVSRLLAQPVPVQDFEQLPSLEALGRILATPVVSRIAVPGWDKALWELVLASQDLELVNERHCFGEAFVFFYGPRGDLSSVPAAWTGLGGPDPFVAVSAGRACFRPRDLLRLAVLLEGIEGRLQG